MLQAIVDFFKSFFSSFSGGGKNDTKLPPAKTPTEYLPEIVDVEPQDGADVAEGDDEIVLVEVDNKTLPDDEPSGEDPPADEGTTGTSGSPSTGDTLTSTHQSRYLWILDNGHGKQTKGKRSPKWSDGKQLLEYEFNRAIVKKIIDALKKKGVQYHNLVPEIDVDNILKERVARANALAEKAELPTVFISVHSNAGPENQPGDWTNAQGIETWYYRTSLNGRKIAKVFQKHLIAKTGWTDRKVRTGMNFYVLKNTSMPAALTENGFFNNKIEGRKLLTEETRQLIADAHVEAIMEIEKYGFDGFQG